MIFRKRKLKPNLVHTYFLTEQHFFFSEDRNIIIQGSNFVLILIIDIFLIYHLYLLRFVKFVAVLFHPNLFQAE